MTVGPALAVLAESGVSDQLVIVIGGVVTSAIVAASGVLVAVINSRGGRTSSSPPSPAPPEEDGPGRVRERVAVLETKVSGLLERSEEDAETIEIQDRRIAHLEGVLDERWHP